MEEIRRLIDKKVFAIYGSGLLAAAASLLIAGGPGLPLAVAILTIEHIGLALLFRDQEYRLNGLLRRNQKND
ncbi:MAG: hypothetical protein LWW87_07510 [Geobacteraceae bacterium]|nr:hypothetical protein [Geobacteraceae bacterium]